MQVTNGYTKERYLLHMLDTIFTQTMTLDARRWLDQANLSHPRRTLTEFRGPVHFTD